MKCAGYVAYMGTRTGVYRVVVEKPEGKRTLGRLCGGWKYNIICGMSGDELE